MERAGFTDVFVTGIETRWMRVNPSADRDRREALRGPGVDHAEDDVEEDRGQHDLDHEAGEQVIAAGRAIAVAIRGKARGLRPRTPSLPEATTKRTAAAAIAATTCVTT